MAVVRGGYAVLPHVQAFVDEVERRFGITSFGTYASHEPTPDRAVDCFGTRAQMVAVAEWCTRNDVIDHFGIDYVIFNINQATAGGEIWNREKAEAWRQMADRGGPTQNHWDHDHVSFEPTGSSKPFGEPTTSSEEDDMGVYSGTVEPGEAVAVPVPPPHGGSAGGKGYNRVWLSVAQDSYPEPLGHVIPVRVVGVMLNGKDVFVVFPPGEQIKLAAGRAAAELPKDTGIVSIAHQGKPTDRKVAWMIEWEKA